MSGMRLNRREGPTTARRTSSHPVGVRSCARAEEEKAGWRGGLHPPSLQPSAPPLLCICLPRHLTSSAVRVAALRSRKNSIGSPQLSSTFSSRSPPARMAVYWPQPLRDVSDVTRSSASATTAQPETPSCSPLSRRECQRFMRTLWKAKQQPNSLPKKFDEEKKNLCPQQTKIPFPLQNCIQKSLQLSYFGTSSHIHTRAHTFSLFLFLLHSAEQARRD
jgi:hypothetical protein